MKRTITTLILLILLTTPLILAAEDTTEPTGEQITDQAKEGLSALRGGLDIKTENVLERIVVLPPILKVPLKLILGIEEDATWEQLIVVLGVFIGFFILIFGIVEFFPMLKEGYIKVLASLVITSLMSITGALEFIATLLYDMIGLIKWVSLWGPLQMILAVLIVIALAYFLYRLSHEIERRVNLEKAKDTGKKIKEGSGSAEVFTEAQEELAKP